MNITQKPRQQGRTLLELTTEIAELKQLLREVYPILVSRCLVNSGDNEIIQKIKAAGCGNG